MTTTRKLHYKSINASASTYIGEPGCIFFDPATNTLRVGDGVTPGGQAATLDIGLATSQQILDAQTHLDASIVSATASLATASGLSAARSDITNILGTGFVAGTDDLHALHGIMTAMASGTNLSAIQIHLDASISSARITAQNAIQGTGFTPGIDDLHAISTAINAIKTQLGI